jgi:hypothetical protein
MERMAKRIPSPMDDEHDSPLDATVEDMTATPTTLRASVRVLPQVKILTGDSQEICMAVEIEGVLHNSNALPHVTADVIFVIDNG